MSEPDSNVSNDRDAEHRTEVRLAAYTELCRSYHAIDDFWAKLLAILPIASGAGGVLLLANKPAVADYLEPSIPTN